MQSDHKIFVSAGDLAGIGWKILKKIILRPNAHLNREQQTKLSSLVVVGDLLQPKKTIINSCFTQIQISEKESAKQILKKLPISQVKPIFLNLGLINVKLGEPSKESATRSFLYLKKAIQLLKEAPNSSLLTLPVSKEWIMKSKINFVGHTEELQKAFKRKTWMCMYHPNMAVLLLTNHIPIKKVSSQIKRIICKDLVSTLLFFKIFFKLLKPMALLGLNPHAGEGGKIGNEEKFMQKILDQINNKGIFLEGIFSADSFFTPYFRKNYSLVIACYHDQGLIPFKALYGLDGINITLNLPKLRVSPDHGPAYSLAKQGNADINSVLKSLIFCFERGESWIKHFSYPLLHG